MAGEILWYGNKLICGEINESVEPDIPFPSADSGGIGPIQTGDFTGQFASVITPDSANFGTKPVHYRRRITVLLQPISKREAARDAIEDLLTALRVQGQMLHYADMRGKTIARGNAIVTLPAQLPQDYIYLASGFTVEFELVERDLSGENLVSRVTPLFVAYGDNISDAIEFPNVIGVSISASVVRTHFLATRRSFSEDRIVITGQINEGGSDAAARQEANLAKMKAINSALIPAGGALETGKTLFIGNTTFNKAKPLGHSFSESDYTEFINYTLNFGIPSLPASDGIYEVQYVQSYVQSVPRVVFSPILGVDGEHQQASMGLTGYMLAISGHVIAETDLQARAFVASLLPGGGVMQPNPRWDWSPTDMKATFNYAFRYAGTLTIF